jgi:cyclase
MTRRLGVCLVLLAGAAVSTASAQTKITPEKLAEGVWAAATPGGANVGWFLMGEDVVAVDTGATPEVGRALVDEIRKSTGRKPRYLIVTHAHRDHAGGLAAFAAAGAQTISAEKAAPGVLTLLDSGPQASSAGAAKAAKPAAAPMVMTVSERLIFVGAAPRRAEIYYLGAGHTQGDLIVALPADGILFSGDLAVNGVLPFLRSADVDPRGWEHILQRLAALKIEKLVPGHGKIGPTEGIADTAAYVARVNEIATRLLLSNPPDGLIEAVLSSPENTIENVKLTPEHVANVKAVYQLAKAERARAASSPTPTPQSK